MEVVACFKQGSLVTDSSKVKGHHKSADGGLSVSVHPFVWLRLVASEKEGIWWRRGIASHIR